MNETTHNHIRSSPLWCHHPFIEHIINCLLIGVIQQGQSSLKHVYMKMVIAS